MASISKKPHFLLFPAMAQGHMIPMIDLSIFLAHQGSIVTIITTPINASRFHSTLSRAQKSNLQIQIIQIPFPFQNNSQIPKGSENFDLLPSLSLIPKFLIQTSHLCHDIEILFENLVPRPDCIVSDMAFPWTIQISNKFGIPRIVFYSLSCFYLSAMANLVSSNSFLSDSDRITVPGFPDPVEFLKSQLGFSLDPEFWEWANQMRKADSESYGFIINTFDELEHSYIEMYKKLTKSDKVWCVGPVCLYNKDQMDIAERGDKSVIDEQECIKWLDQQEPCSVVYAAFGSLSNMISEPLIELGMGLEASKRPFIWVIRKTNMIKGLEDWILRYGFEEKTRDRGILIRGWAPQVLILSHSSIGGFITHCGWNSAMEGIACGVPMITWPLFADQFFNEKLIVQILRIGISLGVEECYRWGDEEKVGVLVKKEAIRDAIESLMNGEGKEEMRRRVKEFGERGKRAVAEGGSSFLNIEMLMVDIAINLLNDTL